MKSIWVPALVLGISMAMAAPAPVAAQGAKAGSPPELARRIEHLKPGEWVWAPEVSPDGPILVFVDLSKQIALVYRNGVRIAATTVSTGKSGYDTPTGVFTVLQKDADHRSSKYKNAPMPYQQRLTWDGVALHAGGLPGYPESHGCVHLPYEFARKLFSITSLGVTVVVDGDAASHVTTSENSLLAPFDAKGRAQTAQPLIGEEYRWNPEAAKQGPLSIIVSRSDQRIVVVRGGVEIGRSAARVEEGEPGSHVITLVAGKGVPRWVYVGMTGHEGDEGKVLDEAAMNRVRMPRKFYELVKAELKPGATILVTDSRVGARPLERLTIMDAVVPRP